jgi:preprotein translocase subunit YajC
MSDSASLTQQRALAYAPKPFAALSILSSIYVFYFLWSHPEKRRRVYHRLVLTAFANVLICSICAFVGSWALPVETDVVGAAGNMTTCSVQGAFFLVGWLALASYYAGFGVYGLVAVKNNFNQGSIKWLEKWIHLWAFGFPIVCLIASGVYMAFHPGSDIFCTISKLEVHYMEPSIKFVIFTSFIMVDFLIGTGTIIFLWVNFAQIQKQVDNAIGMKRLIESARTQRLKDVAQQAMLYLFLFSYGYFIPVLSLWLDILTEGSWVYTLDIVGACISASQGVVFMIIYFALQRPEPESTCHANNTVEELRQSARQPKKEKKRFTFFIFDGTPAEDSPWATLLEVDSFAEDEAIESSVDVDNSMMTNLL